MFALHVVESLLHHCHRYSVTLKDIAQICDISPQHLSKIIRGKAFPSLTTIEKLCRGLDLTPNDLLLAPVTICDYRTYRDGASTYTYPVCPACSSTLDREYQAYCDRCGRKLDWGEHDTLTD